MEQQWLVRQFEENRGRLRAVAYRMLGSLTEADDAVQETWLRLSGSDIRLVENLAGWLTTVVGRVCLDMLRSRRMRGEESLEARLPDPIVTPLDVAPNPEEEVLLADSVGLALLVVLESLAPPERLAFVLHDVFAVPFDEIASILDCTSIAARQLASRARRRVQKADPVPDAGVARQREVVEAFLSAVRAGDFAGLLMVLDPDVVIRSDYPGAPRLLHGASAVARQALMFRRLADSVQPVLVNGTVGFVSWRPDGQAFSVMGFTIKGGKIVEIDAITDSARLAGLTPSRTVRHNAPPPFVI